MCLAFRKVWFLMNTNSMELFSRRRWRLVSAQVLCLWKYKTIETVHQEQWPKSFDNWADMSLHLLLLKSSMQTLSNTLARMMNQSSVTRWLIFLQYLGVYNSIWAFLLLANKLPNWLKVIANLYTPSKISPKTVNIFQTGQTDYQS